MPRVYLKLAYYIYISLLPLSHPILCSSPLQTSLLLPTRGMLVLRCDSSFIRSPSRSLICSYLQEIVGFSIGKQPRCRTRRERWWISTSLGNGTCFHLICGLFLRIFGENTLFVGNGDDFGAGVSWWFAVRRRTGWSLRKITLRCRSTSDISMRTECILASTPPSLSAGSSVLRCLFLKFFDLFWFNCGVIYKSQCISLLILLATTKDFIFARIWCFFLWRIALISILGAFF